MKAKKPTHKPRQSKDKITNESGDYLLTDICPHCGYRVDCVSLMASTIENDQITEEVVIPKKGDITLCVKCGEWSIYDENKKMLKPTEEEILEFGTQEIVKAMRDAWVKMKIEMAIKEKQGKEANTTERKPNEKANDLPND